MAEAEAKQDAGTEDREKAARWIAELGVSEKAQNAYLTRARNVQKKYKMERGQNESRRRFAMLWSNTETTLPCVYARPPEPQVSRRFKDEDPTARAAAEILERSLSFSIDQQDLDSVLAMNAFDFVLCARSQAWERYVPTQGAEVRDEVDVLQVTNDAGVCYRDEESGTDYAEEEVQKRDDGTYYALGEPYRPVVFEESITDYVNIEDFGYTPARTWDEVWYVWRRVFMTRKQLKARFGNELGGKIPLDYGPKKEGAADGDTDGPGRKAAIYEVWDKDEREVCWISKSWSAGCLDCRSDPLQLPGFFPCPKPLFGTLTNNSLIPVPDFALYQDQAEEIDALTSKIADLQDSLRVIGFYAAETKLDLAELLKAKNTMLVPVLEWQALKEGGGVKGNIEWFPLDQVVSALKACVDLRAQLIADVYQVTGIADILRGASDPRETAAAQGLKAQWGSVRIRKRQKEMARFARDVLRIKAEVIGRLFEPETLAKMTGVKLPTMAERQQALIQIQQLKVQAQAMAAQQAQAARGAPGQPGAPMGPPAAAAPEIPKELQAILESPTWEDVMALLRDDASLQFRIDVETDSTIEADEAEEKAQTVELLTGLSNMVSSWGPAVQAQPALAPMAAAVIKWAVRRFRAGRELEAVIDSTMDNIARGGAIPPAGPAAAAPEPPDTVPLQVAQTNLEREKVKQQGETQRAVIGAQVDGADMQLRQGAQQLKASALMRDPQPQGTA